MSERDIAPRIRLPNLSSEVARVYQIRGGIENYLPFNPVVQPVIDLNSLILGDPGEGPVRIPAFNTGQSAAVFKPLLAAEPTQQHTRNAFTVPGNNAYLVRTGQAISQPIFGNGDGLFTTGQISGTLRSWGVGFLPSNYDVAVAFPPGLYYLRVQAGTRTAQTTNGSSAYMLNLLHLNTADIATGDMVVNDTGGNRWTIGVGTLDEPQLLTTEYWFWIDAPLITAGNNSVNAITFLFDNVVPPGSVFSLFWRRFSGENLPPV